MLTQEINRGRYITDVQLIQNIISSYHFIDYGLVTKYADGRVDVTLAHKMNKKEVNLTNVEVLNNGSLAFSVQHTLVEGDIVMLFSSRSLVKDMADFTSAVDKVIDCYSVSGIKALTIAATGKSINTLTVNDDGSYSLVGENYSLDVSADGTMSVTTAKDLSLSIDGSTEIATKGDSLINTTGKNEIKGATIELNGSTKSFVTHAELDSALKIMCASITAHVHPTAAPGPPSPSPVLIGLACNIAAAATTTVKTGG